MSVERGDGSRAGDGEPAVASPETTHQATGDGDKFYQGTILRLYPGNRGGTLRTGNGRDIAFASPDVLILGSDRGFASLSEGMRVGFDLGRTSRGLRVTTIRVYTDGQSGNEVR